MYTLDYSKSQVKKQQITNIACDAEWDTSIPGSFICSQFYKAGQVHVIFRDDVPGDTKQRLNAEANRLGVVVGYVRRSDSTKLIQRMKPGSNSRMLMFFSPKDIEYAVGWERMKRAIDENKLRQRNHISGKIGKLKIRDLCGWAGKGSLASLAATVGVPMLNKSSMDKYKSCMWTGLLEEPELFLQYAVDDVRVLPQIHDAFVHFIQQIQTESLGMADNELWQDNDIPMTVGSLTAHTFERWIYSQAGEMKTALQVAIRKLGLLDPNDTAYIKNRYFRSQILDKYKSVESLAESEGDEFLAGFLEAKYIVNGMNAAGVNWWADRPATESSAFNALVQGGRCNNEMPFDYSVNDGMDIDISGCYGESLRQMTYPIGIPTVWSYSPNETKLSLGKWLARNEGELVPGMWMAVVSGSLPFEQDLIYSKLANYQDIKKAIWTPDRDDTAIPADYVLIRKEIKNGIITSDILNTLRQTATNAEWSAIAKLEVITAVAYRHSDQIETMDEWINHVLAHDGEMHSTKLGTVDKRTRAWFGIEMEKFVGKLADDRKYHKSRKKDMSLPEEERKKSEGMDGTLKLVVNTLYGVIASRYFRIGNTVMANNITARARNGVWMLAKALNLRQCITDGGIYTPSAVPIFRVYRPGMDKFARMWEWEDSKNGYRQFKSIVGTDGMDARAMKHVQEFWQPYNLKFPFKLEHKSENTFTCAAYMSKADYALQTVDGRRVYAIRGKNKNKEKDRKRHPQFELLDNILLGSDVFPSDMSYTKSEILKIGKYKTIQASSGWEGWRELRPGDNTPERIYPARYNNTHFPVQTEAEFKRRRNRRKHNRGQPVKLFERFHSEGISGVIKRMKMDNLRG